MNIGFIGLGIMGSRMANNLLKSNNKLFVYNRTKEKANELISAGAVFIEDMKILGEKSDVLFTMLSDPNAVDKMVLGENSILSAMKENSIWIDCTTVNPEFSLREQKEANSRKIRFIDAPVAGTKLPAERGELVLLAGGDKKDIEEVTPLLNFIGKKIIHVGEAGKGAAMKMAVNVVLGLSMAAYAEALNLGEAFGLEKTLVVETLNSMPVTSKFLQMKERKLIDEDFETEFPLQWMHKDLYLASKEAYKHNLPVPVINAAKELFAMAKKNGFAEMDISSIYKYIKG